MLTSIFIISLMQIINLLTGVIPTISGVLLQFTIPSQIFNNLISLNNYFPIYYLIGAIIAVAGINTTLLSIKLIARFFGRNI